MFDFEKLLLFFLLAVIAYSVLKIANILSYWDEEDADGE